MLAMRETLEKINSLNNENAEIVVNLIDYLSAQQNKKELAQRENGEIVKRDENIRVLSDIASTQTTEDEDYVSDRVIDNALRIVFHMIRQPQIFRTFENSIHLQFETSDKSYLEFEIFEERMTCMMVPQRDYDKASSPEVSLERCPRSPRILCFRG